MNWTELGVEELLGSPSQTSIHRGELAIYVAAPYCRICGRIASSVSFSRLYRLTFEVSTTDMDEPSPPRLPSPLADTRKTIFLLEFTVVKLWFLFHLQHKSGEARVRFELIEFLVFSNLTEFLSNIPSFFIKSRLPVWHGACVHPRRSPWLILTKMTAYHKYSGPRKWSKSLRYKLCRNLTLRR